MGDSVVETVLHVGAEHSESPVWDAAAERLWWVDIMGAQVHCFDPGSGADTSWRVDGQPGGVVLDAHGEPVVAAPDGLRALDRETGATELLVRVEPEKPENRMNDVKVDSRGRVWAGTMAYDKRPGNAGLYRIEGDEVVCMVGNLTISNGPGLDERAGRMYLADTALGIVDVLDFDSEEGAVDGRRRFLDFTTPGTWPWPDGMTVDDEGMLWIALGRAGTVNRYRGDGRLDGVVELPPSNPTSVAFGGTDGGDLYITSSWFDLDEEARAAQPLAGAIFRCRPGPTGRPSPRAGFG